MDQGAATILPTDPKRAKRARPVAALGAVGLGAVVLLGGAWILRLPAADALLRSAVAERGATAAFTLEHLDLTTARLSGVRLGPAARPDFEARAVTLAFGWGFGPRLSGVAIEGGRLRATVSPRGLELGDVGKLTASDANAPRKPLPDLAVTTSGFIIETATPYGPVTATVDAAGRLTRDFKATAAIAPTAATGAAGRIKGLSARAIVETAKDGLALRLTGAIAQIDSEALKAKGVQIEATGAIDHALTAADGRATIRLDSGAQGGMAISGWSGAATVAATGLGPGLRAKAWRANARTDITRATAPGSALDRLTATLDLAGDDRAGKGAWRVAADATAAGLTGPVVAEGRVDLRDGRIAGAGAVTARGARAKDPAAMAGLLDVLGATPAGPAAAATKPALARALADFDLDAPIAFAWAEGAGAVRGAGPVTARAASDAALDLAPPANAPPWQVTLPGPGVGVAGVLSLRGGGLPEVAVQRFAVDIRKGETTAAGRLTIAAWRGGGASLAVDDLDLAWRGDAREGRLSVAGDVLMTGPFAGFALTDARAPLDLDIHTRGGGWRVSPRAPCLPIAARTLEAAGLRFADARLDICAGPDGALATATPSGALSGTLRIAPATLRGVMAGERKASASLSFKGATAAFDGAVARPRVRLAADALTYTQAMATDRTLTATIKTVTATMNAGRLWRIEGDFAGADVDDPGLAAAVRAGAGDFTIEPAGEAAIIRVADMTARVTDKAARPAFNPLTIAGGTAVIADGIVRAAGDLRLESTGATLARYEATHDIGKNEGEAVVRAADLRFTDRLQPFQISELARGVVENVDGPIDVTAHARWVGDVLTTDGVVKLQSIAAATAGLGPISGVSGAIQFDDLTKLTTPPGQEIRLGEINPGVIVRDGVVRFQLMANGVIALESAQFPFAHGTLSVQPATVTIGAAETRYALELKDIDVAQLIRDLDFKDLTATGRVQGVFPLIVTPTGARIENGLLTAAPGGGTIAYTGPTSDAVTSGPGQVAFDALRSFRYDNLALELNGDLDGEIVTGIRFQGVNEAPISAANVAPGMRTFGATGLPFRFNVTVRAPFKALAEGMDRFVNPLKAIGATQTPLGVDPSKVP